MTKLNQIVAIEKGVKTRCYSNLSELNKIVQHSDMFAGFIKAYRKKDEESEDLPPEKKKVRLTGEEVCRMVRENLSLLMNTTARKDWTNNVATADVYVDGQTILEAVPITHLLFLEKQLTDVRTIISNIPVLDEADDWKRDDNAGIWKTEPLQTHRTKKVSKPIVLYDATPEHPAQTQMITEDVLAGHWETIRHSGAMSKPDKESLLRRAEKLLDAVKQAREEANSIPEVDSPDVGQAIFSYLLDN